MKTGAIFFSHCPRDALRLTDELDPRSELAYRRICDFVLSNGDALRDDDERLAWMTKTGRSWKTVKANLLARGLILIEDGRITSRECQVSLAAAERNMAQRRDAGARSAELRNTKSCRVDPPKALTENETDPTAVATNHKPITNNQEESEVCVTRARDPHRTPAKTKSTTPDPIELDREFDDLLRQWPRGERAAAARAEYHRKRRTVDHETIAAGVKRVVAQRPDPRWVPHFVKWLEGSCWGDQKEFFLRIDGDVQHGENSRGRSPGRAGSAHAAFTAGVDLLDAAMRGEDGDPGRRQRPDPAPEWPMVSAAGDG